MDLNSFMQKYAEEIDGNYSEYDTDKSIIIVPVTDGRIQTVLGHIKESERYEKNLIEFSSRVAKFDQSVDLKNLLQENTNFCHAKFSIVDDFIQVEASGFVDTASENLLKEIIQEVAILADDFEMKLTGKDVH